MPELVIFRSKHRIEELSKEAEPRYTRRLSDQITTAFYEACRIGNLAAAQQLMHALEWESARSTTVFRSASREDEDDMVAVRARYSLEIKRHELRDNAGADEPAYGAGLGSKTGQSTVNERSHKL